MAVINDYDQALKLSSTGFFVTFLLDRCLESTVRSLRSPSALVNGWQTVLMGVSFVAVLIAPPCLAYALLLTNGGDLSSAVCQTLPTFWMCGKVCGSLVGSSTVIDRVRAALRDSTVANSNDDARIVETLPKLVRLIVNCCVYTCVIEVLVSAGYVRVAEICGNLCFWTLTVEAGVVVCKAIAAVWYRFRRSRALASLHQPSQQQLTQLNDEGEKCAICLGEMLDAGVECVLLTQCGHAFHRICLIWWLNDHFTCPMCRQRIIGRPMCIGDLAEMLLPDDY